MGSRLIKLECCSLGACSLEVRPCMNHVDAEQVRVKDLSAPLHIAIRDLCWNWFVQTVDVLREDVRL